MPFLTAFIIFFIFPSALSSSPNDSVVKDWQTLEWSEDEEGNVSFYEVIVERLERKKGVKKYIECARMKVSGSEHSVKMNPLLKAGEYRYKVIAFNLLNIMAFESDWQAFSIVEAREPVIRSVTLEDGSTVININNINRCVINITGKNLFTSEVKEGKRERTQYILYRVDTGEAIPLTVEQSDGQNAVANIDISLLKAGTYRVEAKDISGLKSREASGIIEVISGNSNDYFISICYNPLFIVHDSGILNTVQEAGGAVKGGIIASKDDTLYFGAALGLLYNKVESIKGEDGALINALIMLTCQKPFMRRKAMLDGSAGFGVMAINGMENYSSTLFPSFSLDANFQYMLLKNIYAEIGIGGIMSLMKKDGGGAAPSFFTSARIGIGYRFTKFKRH